MAIDATPSKYPITPYSSGGLAGPPLQHIPWCCHRLTQLEATTARIDTDVSQLKADVTQLKIDVTQLKFDVSQLKIDMACVKERLTHMPTKAQLLVWGLGAAAVVIAAQWRIVVTLLEAQNAALAAQLARAISS